MLATISGRQEYTDPGEKFENVTMLLYQPMRNEGDEPWVRLVDTVSGKIMSESEYLGMIRAIHNRRNPHATIGEGDELELGSQ